MGGVRAVMLTAWANVLDKVVYDGVIAWIDIAEGSMFTAFELPAETAQMALQWYVDKPANNRYVEANLSLYFPRMETGKRVELEKVVNMDLAVLVQDRNGKWWFLGDERPVTLAGGGGATGAGPGDRNGYTLELTNISKTLPLEVPDEIVARINKDFNVDFNNDFTIFE